MLESWQDQIAPEHTALVMIDFQNDLVSPDGWVLKNQIPHYDGDTGHDEAKEHIVRLLQAARSADVLRVFVRMIVDAKYLSDPIRAIFKRHHGYAAPPCVREGTWGAQWVEGLEPDGSEREVIIDKHRFSAFTGTRLDQVLGNHGIKTTVICGTATSGCVESTWRDAFMHDYYVVVPRDAVADYEKERHEAALSKAAVGFGHVITTDDIVKQWK